MVTIELLSDLARRAGAITLQYFNTHLEIISKSDNSPVTIADRSTEEWLRAEIGRRFPNDGIVGEEYGTKEGSSGRRWILDPIDGTRSFIHGVPLYGVMIGVENDGEMMGGAIYVPPLNEMVVAVRGQGCYWNGRRASVSVKSKLEEATICTSDIMHHYEHNKGAGWDALCRRVALVRTWGDCFGYIMVATGRADVMLDAVMSPWDIAALQPIIEEAGGRLTDYEGNTGIYGKDSIGSNGLLHDEVLKIVAG